VSCPVQTELEEQVRRGAAERGVAELKKNEFQEQIQTHKEELQQQGERISSMAELHRRQLEEAQSTCGKDKVCVCLPAAHTLLSRSLSLSLDLSLSRTHTHTHTLSLLWQSQLSPWWVLWNLSEILWMETV